MRSSDSQQIWIWSGLVLASGVGLVVAAGGGSASGAGLGPAGVLVGPSDRVLLLGDSLAVGLATPMGKLASGSGNAFHGAGRVGTRIQQWGAVGAGGAAAQNTWLDDALGAEHPTVVLVSLGTNDMLLPDPTKEQSALEAMLLRISAAGARVVWFEPPAMPFDPGQSQPAPGSSIVRAMIRHLAETGSARVLSSQALEIPRGPDQIHPTVAGYSGWAAVLWRWLTAPAALRAGAAGAGALAGILPRRSPARIGSPASPGSVPAVVSSGTPWPSEERSQKSALTRGPTRRSSLMGGTAGVSRVSVRLRSRSRP